jgi:hypothetical protein
MFVDLTGPIATFGNTTATSQQCLEKIYMILRKRSNSERVEKESFYCTFEFGTFSHVDTMLVFSTTGSLMPLWRIQPTSSSTTSS